MTIEVKQPTEEELRDFLMRKFLEEKLNQEAAEARKKTEEKYIQRLRKVSPDLFLLFLSQKGVPLVCPSCGSSSLSIPESFTMEKVKQPSASDNLSHTDQGDAPQSLPDTYVSYIPLGDRNYLLALIKSYYQVHCMNCGHLTLYRSATVLNWLEKINLESEAE
ncbi:hypothetical protein [Serratia fonticola]|uniref:hypothetical protein n=1 Tax=Serratia fonticola TaxID=47917 RepID=UPI003BB65A2A